ncbi:MAG TPA: Ig-like domain-containing protein [Anaeromyxobacteraceae bacterium]|jgi:hypothetical protein|nr:Ig-like domain-containing protein [Anaeromyxobacteraceae bacterium]
MRRFPFLSVVATGLLAALALSGCGGAGGGTDWYYHWSCNGDSQCLGDNPTGQASGTSGPISGGQVGCNELMTFGSKFWNVPPATQSCDNSPSGPSAKLTALAVTPQGPSIAIGATQQFTANASYSDGSTKDVTGSATWTSSASNVASVGSSGLATGVAVGSASIRASYGGASASSTLTVTVSFTVTSFSPGGGVPGTAITIAGANFPTAGVTVKVCGTAVPLVSASAAQLVVDAPTASAGASTAVSSTTACTVSVTTSQGTVTAPAPFQVLTSSVPSVYFLEGGSSGSAMVVAKSGGTAHTLASGLLSPTAIAATPWAVYWLEGTSTGELKMVGSGGGAVTTLAACNVPFGVSPPLNLTVDGAGNAFCGTSAGLAVVPPGGAASLLAPAASGIYDSIALNGTNLYWTERASGSPLGEVRGIATSGGAATTLASGISMPTGIAADAASVYFIAGGAVRKVPLSGGTPVMLAILTGSGDLTGVGLDSTYYYWADIGSIYRLPLAGGTPAALVSNAYIGGMALDGTNLYWTDSGALKTMPKGGGTIITLVSGGAGGAVAVTP